MNGVASASSTTAQMCSVVAACTIRGANRVSVGEVQTAPDAQYRDVLGAPGIEVTIDVAVREQIARETAENLEKRTT